MDFSDIISCGHCGNISKMEIIGSVTDNHTYESDPGYGPSGDWSDNYCVLKCPACEKINIVSYVWHDAMGDDYDVAYNFLHPQNSDCARRLN